MALTVTLCLRALLWTTVTAMAAVSWDPNANAMLVGRGIDARNRLVSMRAVGAVIVRMGSAIAMLDGVAKTAASGLAPVCKALIVLVMAPA